MNLLRIRIDQAVIPEATQAPKAIARVWELDDFGHSVPETLHLIPVPVSTKHDEWSHLPLKSGTYFVEVRMPSGETLGQAVNLSERTPQDVVLTPSRDDTRSVSLVSGVNELVLSAGPAEPPTGAHKERSATVASRASSQGLSPPSTARAVVGNAIVGRNETLRPSVSGDGSATGLPVSNGLTIPIEKVVIEYRVNTEPAARKNVQKSRVVIYGNQEKSIPTEHALESVGLRMFEGKIEPREKIVSGWPADAPAKVKANRPLYLLTKGPANYDYDILSEDPWRVLPVLNGSTKSLVNLLGAGRSELTLRPQKGNAQRAHFAFSGRLGDETSEQRRFAAVHRRQGLELLCIPAPWRNHLTGEPCEIEVEVNTPQREGQFATRVSIRDSASAFLLAYLSSGSLPEAEALAKAAGAMLFEKDVNPFAAAAGGYALVNGLANAKVERWHQWIENLMNRFSHVPDGAIQYATLRLRLRSNENDVEAASVALKTAYSRGLPYYTLGVRWLMEGLMRLSARDSEASAMAHNVRALAARVYAKSTFTVVRVGRQ